MFTCLNTSAGTQEWPSLHEGHVASQITRLCDRTVCLETFLLTLPTRVARISMITSTCPPRSFLWICATAGLRRAGQGPQVWRASDQQGSQDGKLTETYSDALCWQQPGQPQAQQLGQRRIYLVVDVVNHFSEVGRDSFVVRKFKKNEFVRKI